MPDEQNGSELPSNPMPAGEKGVYPIEDPTTANAMQAGSIVLSGAGLAATAAATSPDGGDAVTQSLLDPGVLHSLAGTLGFAVDSPTLLAIGLALGTLGLVLNVLSYRLHRRFQGQWNEKKAMAATPDTGRRDDPRVNRSLAS